MLRPQNDWMLYALKLEHGEYYVDRALDVLWRYRAHIAGTGTQWTTAHRPMDLIETKRIDASLKDEPDLGESNLTSEYMARYGWQNVRVGDFTILDDAIIEKKLVASGLMLLVESIRLRLCK
jgi:hypothetical protein